MKILEIAGSGTIGTQEMGPVSNVIYQLSTKFVEFGHDVTVVDAKTNFNRSHLSSKLKLVEVDVFSRAYLKPLIEVKGRLSKPLNYVQKLVKTWFNEWLFIRNMLQVVKLDAYDIIHVHERKPAWILQKIYRKDIVYTIHTPGSWCNSFQSKRNITKVIDKISLVTGFHEVKIIKEAKLAVSLGAYINEALPDANIKCIPNGINPTKWVRQDRKASLATIGLNKDDFTLLFVGRVLQPKGIHLIIKAIQTLSKEIKNLKVLIVGSLGVSHNQRDQKSNYAKQMITKAQGLPIQFEGFVNNKTEAFKAYLSAADLLIVPSLFDNQPTVILEALTMGLPIIGSNVGGIPDMVTDEVGSLFEPNNAKDLSRQIKHCYEDTALLSRLKNNARSYIKANYTWKKSAQSHIIAFTEMKNRV